VSGFSPDGRTLYYTSYLSNLVSQVYQLDLEEGGEPICILGEGKHEQLFTHLAVHPESGDLYLAEDSQTDHLRLSRFDSASGQIHAVQDLSWNVENVCLSGDGHFLAYVINREGISQLWLQDLLTEENRRVEGMPPGVIEGLSFSGDGQRLTFTFCGDRHPSNVWIAPVGGRAFPATRAPVGRLPYHALHSYQLWRFHSFDGLGIPVWVLGEGDKAIISIHGGPEGQSRPRFNAFAQYMATQGYRVFLPNVRGSSGYGRHYLGLDDVRKRMDSVKDIAALHDWIGEQGLADPGRVAVVGGSYGGFMVLACLTEYPERWRAGLDFVGIANFRTFLEQTGVYRRKIRESEYGSLEHDGDFLDSISPIHKVDRICCPLFVAHGANDPRVPLAEAEQVVEALRAKQLPHEFLVFPDEGHGLAKRANRILLYERVAAFLETHL
jgi:dipeptidyl aminopeptidase/acylaminoacyl peptidase